MNDWLHHLPVVWMALVVFGSTYLVAATIYALVKVLAVGGVSALIQGHLRRYAAAARYHLRPFPRSGPITNRPTLRSTGRQAY
jgi:hypothetical protein